jgi:hypothetical protein
VPALRNWEYDGVSGIEIYDGFIGSLGTGSDDISIKLKQSMGAKEAESCEDKEFKVRSSANVTHRGYP